MNTYTSHPDSILPVLPSTLLDTSSALSDGCQMRYSMDSMQWAQNKFVFVSNTTSGAFIVVEGKMMYLTLQDQNRHATAYKEIYTGSGTEVEIIATQERKSAAEASRFEVDFKLMHSGKQRQWKLYANSTCP